MLGICVINMHSNSNSIANKTDKANVPISNVGKNGIRVQVGKNCTLLKLRLLMAHLPSYFLLLK